MIISLFAAVLLIQTLIYVVNAVGAKAINELVGRMSQSGLTQGTDTSIAMGVHGSSAAEIVERCERPIALTA